MARVLERLGIIEPLYAHDEKATTQADRAAVGARANAATGALHFFEASTQPPYPTSWRPTQGIPVDRDHGWRIIQSSGSLWPPPSRPLDHSQRIRYLLA